MQSKLPKDLRHFIAKSATDLPATIRDDQKFDLRLRVSLELASKSSSSLAIQFVRFDNMSEPEKAALTSDQRGLVVVRDQKRNVSNYGRLKPKDVVAQVSDRISFMFNMAQFVEAWRREEIRPRRASKHPHRTKEEFCTYDEPHKDYVYSAAYVEHLVRELSTESGLKRLTGSTARPVKRKDAATA